MPTRRFPALVAVLLIGALNSPALTNKVLIIGIDGTMCSALAVAKTPNLDALKSNGCYTVRAVTHPVTHSAACWSSMFTGVWGDKHLVNDPGNSFTGNNLAGYPSFFKRLEAANPNWNTLCFARWSPLITVVPDADAKLSFGTDAAITAETCQRLTNSNPDVFYMILLDVDSAGHSYGWGPNVTNYVKAIETADGRVGQIIHALQSRATYTNENWLVIAMTDHGEHDHPDLERSRITWHIISGPAAARGAMWPSPSIVDVCPTVLTHMGVPIDPAWDLDGRVEGLPLEAVRYGTNLIYNGDADATSGTGGYATNRGIAWWFDTASTTLGIYGGNARFPSAGSPGPENRGANFFLGGTTSGLIFQRVDISELARDVDDGIVDYALSGWFGGAEGEDDRMALTVSFLDMAGAPLGSNTIGNVTASERGGVTGLVPRFFIGVVPAGTRFFEFLLASEATAGTNDASADNLSFVLSTHPDPSFRISIAFLSPEARHILVGTTMTNRLYVLEHSSNLQDWETVSLPAPGTGSDLVLVDTNAISWPGFYRVQSKRP